MLRVNNLSGFGKKPHVIGGGGGDADVAAFISATGISDPTIEAALETLVTSLKTDGIWTKCIAIYPFVGGDATKHSYNLKNTANHQITWNGTVTHNANGITGNGSSGYGDLNITPSTHLTEDDTHISLYCRTAAETGTQRDIGCLSDGGTRFFAMLLSRGGSFQAFAYNTGTSNLSVSNANADGFYIATRRGNTDFEGYKNGSSIATNTNADGSSRPTVDMYICARNVDGTAGSFTNRNYAFCSVGSGLTDTEAADFTTAIEVFQDALSRGVV